MTSRGVPPGSATPAAPAGGPVAASAVAPTLPLSFRLTTDRLVLRPPQPGDVGAIRHAARRNVAHLKPWEPLRPNGEDATSLTQISNNVLRARKAWRKGEAYELWMFDATDEDRVLGRIHLSNVQRGAFHNANLGYSCDVAALNRGYVTEGARVAIGFAFEIVRLHRVAAAVMPRNAPSLRVLAKLGFREEGFALRYLQIAGTWEDHVLFAMTREEWRGGSDHVDAAPSGAGGGTSAAQ